MRLNLVSISIIHLELWPHFIILQNERNEYVHDAMHTMHSVCNCNIYKLHLHHNKLDE